MTLRVTDYDEKMVFLFSIILSLQRLPYMVVLFCCTFNGPWVFHKKSPTPKNRAMLTGKLILVHFKTNDLIEN